MQKCLMYTVGRKLCNNCCEVGSWFWCQR